MYASLRRVPGITFSDLELKESLRLQVEEELEMARSKINAITKKIESRKCLVTRCFACH